MDEIAVVLADVKDSLDHSGEALDQARKDSNNTARAISALEAEVAALATSTGIQPSNSPDIRLARSRPASQASGTWTAALNEAEQRMRRRGADPSRIDINSLLSEEEMARIQSRFEGQFRLTTKLDRYDVACLVLAATVGALVDVFWVRIPQSSSLLAERGAVMSEGSPMTGWMRDRSFRHDNALSEWFKVPFDRVDLTDTGEVVAGSGGKTHRFHTLGHDPLLGLLFGIVDIFYGSTTAIDRHGDLKYIPGTGPRETNPLLAVIDLVGHVLSDAFTGMGVPAPGWTALGGIQLGALGEHRDTVGQVARKMYLAGYDSRHFLTQTTSVAAIDLTLWVCWHLRHHFDDEWREQVDHEERIAGSSGVRQHPRYEAMALGSHLIACAANGGKIALYGGSPLALNYAQWMRFLHATYRYSRRWFISPSELMIRHAAANADALLDGWPDIDFSLPDAPTLDAAA